VLEAGRIIASGTSTELARSETVRKAYFGDLTVAETMTAPTGQEGATMTEVSR
jgi:ABC-type hemin transport system ATPase subunit